MKKLTQKEYIERFKIKHNNFYEYSDFPENYNQKTNIEIICPIHGSFNQRIINHGNGMGCPICGVSSRKITKQKNSGDNYKNILSNLLKQTYFMKLS